MSDEVLGEALPSSAVRPAFESTVVCMKGTAGFCRALRCTIVCVPLVPINLVVRPSIWSESLCDKLLLVNSRIVAMGVVSECSLG